MSQEDSVKKNFEKLIAFIPSFSQIFKLYNLYLVKFEEVAASQRVSVCQFPQASRPLALCCPHLVNMTHGARSTFLSSSKCDGNFHSAGSTERHTRTLFVSKDGGSPEAAVREPAGL